MWFDVLKIQPEKNYLGIMVVQSVQPLSTFEDKVFPDFVHDLDPEYMKYHQIPLRYILSNKVVLELYENFLRL